jgi:glutathione S-transferase
MSQALLYTYRRCPYAMRARMALLQAGVVFDAFEIVLRDKPPEMLALSPKGTVPVLLTPAGHVIAQSWDIMAWAYAQHDSDQVWARAQSQRLLDLVALNDGLFKQELDRYKYPQRWGLIDGLAHRDAAMREFFPCLSQALAGQPFLGGDSACAADWAIAPFVRQFAAVDTPWFRAQSLVDVANWLDRCLSSTLFEACMQPLPAQSRVLFPAWMAAPTRT